MQVSTIKLQYGEEPFGSLNEMRESHLALLEKQGEQTEGLATKTQGFVPEIEELLRRGVGLGRSIDAPDLRAEAQNILDYWLSTLSLRQRGVSDDKARTFSAAILERFDPSLLGETIESAGQVLLNLTGEKKLQAKRLLMRLAPMSSHGETFKLTELPTQDLTGGDPEQLSLLQEFEKTGVIQRAETAEGKVTWRIVHHSVIHRWPEFAEWTTARRRFRHTAEIWDEAKRSPSALPRTSDNLEEPMAYRDLNALESDYFEEGSTVVRLAEKQKRRAIQTALGILITGIIVVATLGSLWWLTEREKDVITKEKKIVKGELEVSEGERNQAEIEVTKQTTGLERVSQTTQNIISEKEQLDRENQILKERIQSIEEAYQEAETKLQVLRTDLEKTNGDNMAEQLEKVRVSLAEADLGGIQKELPKYDYSLEVLVNSPKSISDNKIIQALNPKARKTISPGFGISSFEDQKGSGSAGVFLENLQGEIYLAAPVYIVGSTPGQIVEMNGKPFAKVEKLIGNSNSPATQIALAKVNNGFEVENLLPSIGDISDWVRDPMEQPEIILIGQGSGARNGTFEQIQEDGNYQTSRISQPGDAGAPVVTNDGRFLGILVEANGNHSVVSPASRLLQNTGYTLLQSPDSDSGLRGALTQFIVPDSSEKYQEFGKKLIAKVQKMGVFVPDGAPLLRPNTPQQVDIRFYYEDDQKLARTIEQHLREAGFTKFNVYNNLATIESGEIPPPRRFVQIAFNKEQLDEVLSN